MFRQSFIVLLTAFVLSVAVSAVVYAAPVLYVGGRNNVYTVADKGLAWKIVGKTDTNHYDIVRPAKDGYVYCLGSGGDMWRFDIATGTEDSAWGVISGFPATSKSVKLGNDGMIYVASGTTTLKRVDPATKTVTDVISGPPAINDVEFTAGGDAYVSIGSGGTYHVYKYAVVPSGTWKRDTTFNIVKPDDAHTIAALALGSDGYLYIGCPGDTTSNAYVYRYSLSQKALDSGWSRKSGVNHRLYTMSFGPDGNLYASSLRGLNILTTDTAPGTLVDMKNYGSAVIGVNSVAWYNPTTAH